MREKQQDIRSIIPVDDPAHWRKLRSFLDAHMRTIESALGVAILERNGRLRLVGQESKVETACELLATFSRLIRNGGELNDQDVERVVQMVALGGADSLDGVFEDTILISAKRQRIVPKSATQREYVEAIRTHDLVVAIGPAGTGKTYLAMAMAVSSLLSKEVSRIILARPAVEAGESLGFLPGDMYQKVNPYLRPLYDALYDMLDVDKANRLVERGLIEIAPIAFMRGRTLNDSFIILDEAQNTTSEQMKMFLTRLGFNSKAVITGDVTQIDLPKHRVSGLVEAEQVLRGIPEIRFVYFGHWDVVRHNLVQRIIQAYEKHDSAKKKEE
jgi:phosphate starvation-inducible PhoH-like protein